MFNWFGTSGENTSGSAQSERGFSRSVLTSAMGLTTSRASSSWSGVSETPSSLQLLKRMHISSGSPTSKEHAKEIVQQLGEHEETRAQEDEEERQLHKEKTSLEQDSYGLLIMRILYWKDGTESAVFWTHHGIEYEGSFRHQHWLALFHGCLLFILTVVTQILVTAMLFFSSRNSMQPWSSFGQRHGITINEAANQVSHAIAHAISLDPELLGECKTTWNIRENEVFPFILILWTAKMVPEFKMAKKSLREILSMDLQHAEEPMLAADGCTVLRMAWSLRTFLMLTVPVVRAGVAIFLFTAGCDFICSQEKTGSVVLKGMCMFFVTDIDTIFLKAFSSESAQNKLKSFRLMVSKEQNIFGAAVNTVWDHGLAGLIYIVFVMSCVCYQTGFLGYAREVPLLDHTKAQLYHFRVTCNAFCSEFDSPCE